VKARRLSKMRIKRVDLVPKGANQGAHVVLFKSEEPPMKECKDCGAAMKADEKECAKCSEEMAKAATAAKEKEVMDEVKKMADDLKAAMDLATEESKKREAVEKSLKDQGETIAQLKKQLDASTEAIKKAEDAAKLAKFAKSVDEFEHLPVKAEVFAPVLMKCAEALDEAGFAELMRVLKAADGQAGSKFVEVGAPGHNSGAVGVMAEIEAKASDLIAKGTRAEEAHAEVLRQNPKLADRYRRESYAKREN
jgi:septal ring factor EnvC (AmiA/AmiB activator)